MLGYSAGPMTDRDLLEPTNPAGPRKRRPGVRALGSMSDALARLLPHSRGGDGYDAPTGTPMSDEELREAFRLASLTVTPAPLGRPSRREDPGPPAGESGEVGDSGDVGDSGRDVASPLRTPTVAPPPTEAVAAPVRPADPAVVSTAPVVMSAAPVVMSAAPTSGSTAVPEASPISVPASAPDAGRPIGDLPTSDPADPIKLPGNLGSSTDDFFGGLVRRIERRP